MVGDIQELARTYTPAAIKALVEALDSPRERVAAATALLDRGYGRPAQSVALTGDKSAPIVFQVQTGIPRAPNDVVLPAPPLALISS